MELTNLFIEPTIKTPQIDLNHVSGELILSGRSYLENASLLYNNVLNWVVEYSKNPRNTTNLRLNLEYFNTATTIWLAKIIKSLCSIEKDENILIIHLYFNIEEFDNMEVEDIKDTLNPIVDMIGTPKISYGIKIYGTNSNGEILKKSMILL